MRDRTIGIWIALAIVVLAALNVPPWLARRVKSSVREAVAPLQGGVSNLGARLREAASVVRGLGGLAVEHREMSRELTELRNRVRALEPILEENARLRAALDFTRRHPRRLIASEVIGRDISGWWTTIRLGKGSEDGLAVDQSVITAEGLIGRVTAVSPGTADVLLLTDPTCRISARAPRSGTSGVLTGRRRPLAEDALCRLDFVSKDVRIRVGDEIVTSGLGGIFPGGLLIGYVDRIYRDEDGLYQYADVIPTADLERLTVVFAITKREPTAPAAEGGGL